MAADCKIAHGFAGYTEIGDLRVLCRPGARLSMPRNLDIPYPISGQSFGPLNYVDGLRFPVLQLPSIPMDMYRSDGSGDFGYAPWFTGEVLKDWYVDRSAGPCYDLGESNIYFSDNGVVSGPGLGTAYVPKAKAAGFTLRIRKGETLQFMQRWAGVDRFIHGEDASYYGGPASVTDFNQPTVGLEGAPINYSRVTLGGGFADVANNPLGIVGITINFDTGLTPNMELNGQPGVSEHNADLPTASVVLECNSYPGLDYPGFDSTAVDFRTRYPEVDSGTIDIVWNGATGDAMQFTFPRLVIQDPDDRVQQAGRVMRQYTYNALATTTLYPLNVEDI